MEVTIELCKRKTACVDCDNTECWHHGKKESDCPKWRCDRPKEYAYDCEHCAFIDKIIEQIRQKGR